MAQLDTLLHVHAYKSAAEKTRYHVSRTLASERYTGATQTGETLTGQIMEPVYKLWCLSRRIEAAAGETLIAQRDNVVNVLVPSEIDATFPILHLPGILFLFAHSGDSGAGKIRICPHDPTVAFEGLISGESLEVDAGDIVYAFVYDSAGKVFKHLDVDILSGTRNMTGIVQFVRRIYSFAAGFVPSPTQEISQDVWRPVPMPTGGWVQGIPSSEQIKLSTYAENDTYLKIEVVVRPIRHFTIDAVINVDILPTSLSEHYEGVIEYVWTLNGSPAGPVRKQSICSKTPYGIHTGNGYIVLSDGDVVRPMYRFVELKFSDGSPGTVTPRFRVLSSTYTLAEFLDLVEIS